MKDRLLSVTHTRKEIELISSSEPGRFRFLGVLETKPIRRNQQALQEEEKKKLLLDRESNHQC